MSKKVLVSLREKSYPIYIGSESLQKLPMLLSETNLGDGVVIVSQKPIWKAWGKNLKTLLDAAGVHVFPFVLSGRSSEKMKNFKVFEKLLAVCAKADKKSKGIFVIGLGGGVVGDLSGFAASVYRRGIPVIHIPTTLTAQVDSAIGGKTGIDLAQGKNLVGSFYQPQFVLVDPQFLKTLPKDYFQDGMAEVIKYAMIKDKKLFRLLETKSKDIMNLDQGLCEKIIATCCEIKARTVSRDEYDKKGIRAILNFGHTIGHAIESASKYSMYSHGKAVAVGMVAATEMSLTLSTLKKREISGQLKRVLSMYGLPTTLSSKVKLKKILNALLFDKKRVRGQNRFILLKDFIGKTTIYSNVSQDVIEKHVRSLYKDSKLHTKKAGIWERLFGPKKKKQFKTKSVRRQSTYRSSRRADSRDLPGSIGIVETYLSKISVAIISIKSGQIALKDRIRIKGYKGELKMEIRSMQVDRKPVEVAKAGSVVGLRVPRRVMKGSRVYLMSN